jgi:putative ABC transport system permease protein
MFKNYFKIALRNLYKSKLHTGINLIGLSLGLGVSILIFFFIQFELSFDQFHEEGDRVYRLERHEKGEEGMNSSFSIPFVAASTFATEFPQVTHTTRVIGSSAQAYLDENTIQTQQLLMVSPDFLEIFRFTLLEGKKEQVLTDKFGVVITEKTGKKYFGEENPVGKSIRIQMGENYEDYRVTGLLEDLPPNSSIHFEVLMNDENLEASISQQSRESWYTVFGDTYVKLRDARNKADVEAGVVPMMKKVLGERYKEGTYLFTLQPIADIHLSDSPDSGMADTTRPALLWILAGIAFLILLIACINFTTMAIGRSTVRAKEVGVRKTMGAGFDQLMIQFLMEAFLITLAAFVLGVGLAELLLPTFNELFDKQLELQYGVPQLLILLGLILGITALAGAYPAFFMSSLRPIRVLKGNLSIRFGKQGLRKGLVAFQFFISFLLIASTLIMVHQMNSIRNYDLGFDQEMVVLVDVPEVRGTKLEQTIPAGFAQAEIYRQALLSRSEIVSAGITIATYGDDSFWDGGFPTPDDKQFNFRVNFVGGEYVKTLGLELVSGRDLNPQVGADSSSVLINETFAKAMGWIDPLGEMLPSRKIMNHEIVGVLKDFNHNSLYKEIEPVILAKSPDVIFSGINMLMIHSATNPKVIVKGAGTDFEAFRTLLENEWNRVFPMEEFSFSFLDETVQKQYVADERLGKMVFLAACIAILIAAMGLFAMAALSIAGRTKEIGIRKVLGASSWSISWMFHREYLLITLIGVMVALPLSLYFMQTWLEQFAVREWPSWINFFLLTLGAIAFTLAIISAQSYRATQMNPVKTLKDE